MERCRQPRLKKDARVVWNTPLHLPPLEACCPKFPCKRAIKKRFSIDSVSSPQKVHLVSPCGKQLILLNLSFMFSRFMVTNHMSTSALGELDPSKLHYWLVVHLDRRTTFLQHAKKKTLKEPNGSYLHSRVSSRPSTKLWWFIVCNISLISSSSQAYVARIRVRYPYQVWIRVRGTKIL